MAMQWQRVEECVRQYLTDWWGQKFTKQKLLLKANEEELELEFDAVSEDGEIIAEVKCVAHPEHPRELQLARDDILKLEAVRAKRKLLFLVDPLFYQVFCRKYQKELLLWKQKGIEIVSPFELTSYLEE